MTSKSKTVASLLAIFLGSFGAHRFYLRSYGLGVIYLLFCWTLIPGILGIIEGIRYLLMDEEKFNAKYTQESTPSEDTDLENTPRISDDRDESAGTEPNMEISVNFEGFTGGSQVDNEEKQNNLRMLGYLRERRP